MRSLLETTGEPPSTQQNIGPHVNIRNAIEYFAAPTNLTATDDQADRVTVSWNAAPNASGYRIYRSESNSTTNAAEIGTTTTATIFQDSGAPSNSTYWYFVRPETGIGLGEWSSPAAGNLNLHSIDLTSGSDSGSSSIDNVTNDNTPTFEVETVAAGAITLFSDVSGQIGSGNATGAGTWTVTASSLPDGVHVITATCGGGTSSNPLTLKSPKTVFLYTTGNTDTRGALYNDNGDLINAPDLDRNEGEAQNFEIEEILPAGTYNVEVTSEGAASTGNYALFARFLDPLAINEIDPDTGGSDGLEFVELFDGGIGNQSLDGKVLVFYDGTREESYLAAYLDGQSTNGSGFFVIGDAAVANVDLVIPVLSIRPGQDAVAIYNGNGTDFPNGSALTTNGIIDAVVYLAPGDSPSSAMAGLILPSEPQLFESANSFAAGQSLQRLPDKRGGNRVTSFLKRSHQHRDRRITFHICKSHRPGGERVRSQHAAEPAK